MPTTVFSRFVLFLFLFSGGGGGGHCVGSGGPDKKDRQVVSHRSQVCHHFWRCVNREHSDGAVVGWRSALRVAANCAASVDERAYEVSVVRISWFLRSVILPTQAQPGHPVSSHAHFSDGVSTTQYGLHERIELNLQACVEYQYVFFSHNQTTVECRPGLVQAPGA